MVRTLILALGLSVLAGAADHPRIAPADTLILNARIYTVNPAQPWAEAIAISGGRIVAVGSATETRRFRGPKTRVIDARRRLILPGFTDSHIHFMEGALALTGVQLDGTTGLAEIQAALRSYAAAHPAQAGGNPWIVGRGWNYSQFGGDHLPHRRYLDELFPDRPVYLEGFDGHTAWANSKALQAAGITRSTPDPRNGKIVRDANGDATGALQEGAMALVVRAIPPPGRAERLEALRRAMAEANRLGLTRIITCGNDTPNASDHQFAELYAELRQRGQLTLRVALSTYADPGLPAESLIAEAEGLRTAYPAEDPWLAGGAVKFFADGVIEGHTAALLAPYSDDPSTSGSLRWRPEDYRKLVIELDRRGLQIFTHAVGDAAVRLALDAYEEAARVNRTSDARHRIEHIETVASADIPRFGSTGTIASMQPLHAYPDEDTLNVWLRNVGPDRGSRAWAWKSIQDHGGRLAFGSDWPVVTMNPWYGIESAVTRQTREGKPAGGFVSSQHLSVVEAVGGYTLGAAIGGRRERTEGSLEPGKVADLVMLSQDLFTIDPHQIHNTQVLLTMLAGRVVYQSATWKDHR